MSQSQLNIDLKARSEANSSSKKNISRLKLCIHNPHKLTIIFKIQTTHPEELRARPNVGLIEPDQEMIVDCAFPSKISPQTEKPKKKQLAPRKYKIQTITCEDSNLFSLERFEEREVKLRDIFEALMKEKESKPITARLKDFFRGGSDEKRGHVNALVFEADELSPAGTLLKVSGSNLTEGDPKTEDRMSETKIKDE